MTQPKTHPDLRDPQPAPGTKNEPGPDPGVTDTDPMRLVIAAAARRDLVSQLDARERGVGLPSQVGANG